MSAEALKRIPSLDGIRGVAILMVLVGHSAAGLGRYSTSVEQAIDVTHCSTVGVSVFFVLSGYLITGLLVTEEKRRGSISLRSFYLRRFFRIFPAYYVFLTCVLVLGQLGQADVPRSSVVPAYFFAWNYSPQAQGWWYAHTWSLSMEEQFYLLWPPLIVFLGRPRAMRLAVALIVLAPVSRLATYFLLPAFRGQIPAMLHTHGDALMFGAVLALGQGEERFERVVAWLFKRNAHIVAAVALPLTTAAGHLLRGSYELPVGMTVEAASIAILLFWLVRNPAKLVGRVLNSRGLVHIGGVSYSLYLWQQAFLRPDETWTSVFPVSLLLAFVAAEASFWLVETPFLRLRERIQRRAVAATPQESA